MPEKIIEAFIFLFGLIVGSFLNVCVARMPNEGYSLLLPASHCPSCKKPIHWFDNVPLLSFIFLGGKCRFCKVPISFQYSLVEALTGLVFWIVYRYWGFSLDSLMYITFICGLLVATFIDIKWRIIPDEISLGGTVVGLIFFLVKSLPHFKEFPYIPLVDSLVGALCGGALIYGSAILGNFIIFKLMKKGPIEGETECMGGGDVKLLAMIGSFLGWKLTVLTFFLAPFFGAVVGIYVLIFKKSHVIPDGPFLSLAAITALFFGDRIISLVIFHY